MYTLLISTYKFQTSLLSGLKKNLQISNGTVLSFLGNSRIYKLTVSWWTSAAVVMYSSYYTDIFYNAFMFQRNKIK